MIKLFYLPLLAMFVFPMSAFACASSSEEDAFDLRALKNSLMVAAYTCHEKSNYNKFVKRYQDDLTSSGEKIQAYFKRKYGANHEKKMNAFITDLANKASSAAAKKNFKPYCTSARETFKKLARGNSRQLDKIAEQKRFASLHNIDGCS